MPRELPRFDARFLSSIYEAGADDGRPARGPGELEIADGFWINLPLDLDGQLGVCLTCGALVHRVLFGMHRRIGPQGCEARDLELLPLVELTP